MNNNNTRYLFGFMNDVLFQQDQVGVFEFNTQLLIQRFNSRFVTVLQSEAARLQNFDLKNIYDRRLLPFFEKVLNGQPARYTGEYLATTSQARVNIDLELFPILNKEQKVIGGIGFISPVASPDMGAKDRINIENIIKNTLQAATIGIGIIAQSGKIIFLNSQLEQMTGYRLRDLAKSELNDLIHSEFQPLIRESLNLVKMTKSPCSNLEIKIITKSNNEKWLNCGLNLVNFANDNYFLFTAVDTTTHHWTEEELQVQKSFFETLFNISPDAIVVLDTEDRVLQINQRFSELFGYMPEEAIGNYINDLVVPKHLTEEASNLSQMVVAGKNVAVETVRQDKYGRLIDVAISGRPINLGENQLAVYGIYEDITKRRKLERFRQALLEIYDAIKTAPSLNELYASVHKILGQIIDATNFFIALVDQYHREIYFPYACDEVDQDYPFVRLSLDDEKSLTVEVIKTQQPLLLTERMLNIRYSDVDQKQYGTIPRCWLGVPLKIGDEAIGAIVVQSYTTADLYNEEDKQLLVSIAGQIASAIERKAAEIALKESEEKYRLLVENSRDGIIISQHDKLIFVNQAMADMLGYTVDELTAVDYHNVHTQRGLEILAARDAKRQRGEAVPSQYETSFKKKDGTEIDVEANVTIIDYKGEKATFAVIRDISERKKILSALIATAEQSRALGNLIPICAACKKIRDDSKEDKPWVDPEMYISERLKEVNFTHGICPSCLKKLYPDYAKKKNIE